MSNHTPGLWSSGYSMGGYDINDADGLNIATTPDASPESAANARLIALCPSMLKALKDFINIAKKVNVYFQGERDEELRKTRLAAEYLIDRAEGRAE